MVPEKLVTADCHITPPLSIVNELPEQYREYFPGSRRTRTARTSTNSVTSCRCR